MSSESFIPDPPSPIPIPAVTDDPSDLSEQPFNQEEEEAKASYVMEVLLPNFLAIGRGVMMEEPDAQQEAGRLIGALRADAKEAGEGPDGFWTTAAEIVQAALVVRESALELAKRTDELDKRPGFSWKTLCVLCYLGGSMDPHALPRLAVTLHMAVAEYIHRHTAHNQQAYEGVIVPWFAGFWFHIFEKAKFRFYAPKMIEWELNDAVKSPPEFVMRRVLRSAAFGLWEPLPQKGREWFDEGIELATSPSI